ncbi:MAG: hypothetical protein E6H00_12920 [Bacillati bacterium ANGP1]|uniref:Uncharacterized protein n=1 Tax=Candidatus Segetimicrobium genomatis TaxID=2569760 RepID=A0A537JXR3_9BACT|nr:MAG: hypothetical protein E6H00_12920 [Terrabacteria group bacterium ANGP1]
MKKGDHVRVTEKLISIVIRGGTAHHLEAHPHAAKTGVIVEMLDVRKFRSPAIVRPRALVELDAGQELAGQTVVISQEYLEPLDT